MVVHVCNSYIWEAEVRELLRSRTAFKKKKWSRGKEMAQQLIAALATKPDDPSSVVETRVMEQGCCGDPCEGSRAVVETRVREAGCPLASLCAPQIVF